MYAASVDIAFHLKTNTVVFVPRDLDLWSLDPKICGIPGLVEDHVYVKFGDPSCIDFWDIVWKDDKQVKAVEHSTHATAVSLGNNKII